jgi:hypothetical protein
MYLQSILPVEWGLKGAKRIRHEMAEQNNPGL